MINALLGVVVYVCGFGGAATGWHTDYAEAHAAATASDKPLFIVMVEGSSDYAAMIQLGTFLSTPIEQSLRADYVRIVLDVATPEGLEVSRRFGVEKGPHFVIIDRSGKWQVHRQSGVVLDNDLRPVLTRHRRSKCTADGRTLWEGSQPAVTALCRT
jgi:hypothetical protein